MKELTLATIAVVFVITVVITASMLVYPGQQNSSDQVISTTLNVSETNFNFSTNVANHIPGCDISKTFTSGDLSLQVETTSKPLLGSNVCIHVVLRNDGQHAFPVSQYLLVANVTDLSGNVVYHIDWGISPPPNDQNYSLSPGQIWEEGVYWNTNGSLTSVSAGVYHVTAYLVLPSSTARASVAINCTADTSLQSR